jgi:hypothetical protein
VRLAAELAATLPAHAGAPAHLAGVPECLHKYEPLFRRAATERGTTAA